MKENENLTISQSNAKAAYAVADESGRKLLEALFGKENVADNTPAPSLIDYTTIKTYEDACVALGESVDEETLTNAGVPKHIIALMKLELVCKALWGGETKVYPTGDSSNVYWYPWHALWTKSEIEGMNDEQRRGLLSAVAHNGTNAGFGRLNANARSSWANAYGGFRLCLDSEKKAIYFGKQFVELWAEYLAFNFTVGGHLE